MSDQGFMFGGLIPAPIQVDVRGLDDCVFFIGRPQRADETFDDWVRRCVWKVQLNSDTDHRNGRADV